MGILEHGAERHNSALTSVLAEQVALVSESSSGSAVLGEALTHASIDAKLALTRTLLLQPDVLAYMAHSRQGHVTVKLALQVAKTILPTEGEAALSALKAQRVMLATSRYGRALNKHLMQLSGQGCPQGPVIN